MRIDGIANYIKMEINKYNIMCLSSSIGISIGTCISVLRGASIESGIFVLLLFNLPILNYLLTKRK